MIRALSIAAAVATVVVIAGVGDPAAAQERFGVEVDVTTCLVKPKQIVQLGSPVFGVVGGIFVDRGQAVHAGQLVAKLNTTVEEAQVALDRWRATSTTQMDAARTDMVWNQRELARRQQLAGNMFSRANEIDEIVTKIEQDKIAIRRGESDQKTALLEAERSEAQLKLKLIRSPVDGVVVDVKLMPGEYLHEQGTIMTIAQIDPLNVDLVVPAERYGSVRVGMIADLRLAAPVNLTLPATVDAVDPVIDPASDTFRIRLVVPNPANTIPSGVRCSVRLPDGS